METIDIFENCLVYFGTGFLSGVFLAYVGKIIQALWTSSAKFFK